jgi:hypothetical protein
VLRRFSWVRNTLEVEAKVVDSGLRKNISKPKLTGFCARLAFGEIRIQRISHLTKKNSATERVR